MEREMVLREDELKRRIADLERVLELSRSGNDRLWAALRAAEQSNAEPDASAWQLVPKKPTKEMIQAAYDRERDGTTVLYFKMWNAMLDAAPSPPRPDRSGK